MTDPLEKRGSEIETLRRRVNELERWFKLQDTQLRVLERERQKLSALVNHTDAAYLVVDKSLQVVWTNRIFSERFSPFEHHQDAEGRRCHEILCFQQEQCQSCPCARALLSNEVVHLETVLQDGGAPRYLYLSAMPIRSPEGNVDEAIVMFQDITDLEVLRRSAEHLRAAKEAAEAASRAKSEFVANVSHEIRTPMNGVIGMTEVLLDMQLTEEQRECLQIIQGSSNALLGIINDILDFSKIEAGKLELECLEFDLRELLDGLSPLLFHKAMEKGLAFSCSLDPRLLSPVRGDPGRLRQILLNLASNALKFTHRGEVSIRGDLENESGADFMVKFTVRDSGIGISKEAQSLLFESFSQVDASTTRKYGGTGLGLAICKQLVELMGGSIGVESREREGSTFVFTVLLKRGKREEDEVLFLATDSRISSVGGQAPAVDQVLPVSGRQADGAGGRPFRVVNDRTPDPRAPMRPRILLAEDNAVNRRVASALLERLGYDVDCVADGRQALDALQSGRYDLVLMDCQMPEMDGLEATRRIRAREEVGSHLVVVALTANTTPSDRERCFQAGMDDYLTKPVTRADLESTLARWIASPHRPRSVKESAA